MTIREATRLDVKAILGLIQELAEFEKAPDQVDNTAEELESDLFDLKCCEAIVCEINDQIVAFALYYTSYSTWKGKCMYLEDLYVQPQFRQLKIGQVLFDKVVDVARKANYRRMDWQVLDWNAPALAFYKKNGAILDPEWVNGRLFFNC